MRREERGVAEKTRVMATAKEADRGRGTKHTFPRRRRPRARPPAGGPLQGAEMKNTNYLEQRRGSLVDDVFFLLWDCSGMLSEKCQGEEKTRKVQCDTVRWL